MKSASSPKPYEFRDAEEIVGRLRAERGKIAECFKPNKADKFRNQSEELEEIIRDSVGANTLRAFRGLPKKNPAEIFRNWAYTAITDEATIESLVGTQSQGAFDRWLEQFCSSLAGEWHNRTGQQMPYGASRKLPNLLLKRFARWSCLGGDARRTLLGFLHVALDAYSLVAIRSAVPELGFTIPSNATMKFVDSPTKYDRLQHAIRNIAKRADVPPIYFDALVWDMSHRGKTPSSADDLLTQTLSLSEKERAALAQQLLHSLEPDDPDAEDAWADEIQARSDKVHSGNYVAHDWREAVEDIRRGLRRS